MYVTACGTSKKKFLQFFGKNNFKHKYLRSCFFGSDSNKTDCGIHDKQYLYNEKELWVLTHQTEKLSTSRNQIYNQRKKCKNHFLHISTQPGSHK